MATSVLDRKRRVLMQLAQANPRAGTSSRPLDRSRSPPVCLQAGACFFALMSASVKASDTYSTRNMSSISRSYDMCMCFAAQRVEW